MKQWWENVKENAIQAIETFINEFLAFARQVRNEISVFKLIVVGMTFLLAIGFILSNHLSGKEDTKNAVQEGERPTADTPEPQVITIEDRAQAMNVAHEMIKRYSTFKAREPLAEKIKPYVTESFYIEQQQADEQARPTYEIHQSKVLNVEKGFIEPMGDTQLYWTGNVELEITNAKGDKQKETLLYAVTLIKENGWKVSEVELLESPSPQS
jgi:hypothetical protein